MSAKGAATSNTKVKSAISRAEAIQQREQLRQMVLTKFVQEHGKKSKKNEQIIEQEVDTFFKNEKVTEASLKNLKARVLAALTGKACSQVEKAESVKSQKSQRSQKSGNGNQGQPQEVYQRAQSETSAKSGGKIKQDDGLSVASSKAPQSVYYLEGDEEDEWATLVKFDTELHKKEQELEKLRQTEFKKKMMSELDRQLEDKKKRNHDDQTEENAYVELQKNQMVQYDKRENLKDNERKNKIMQEKKQRDKQVNDENIRKKNEKKREKAIDEMLVNRIKEEKAMEEEEQKKKRLREKDRLFQMMKENEEYRKKADEEQKKEKDDDIRIQQEYTKLLVEMENQREQEKKNREEKIKRIMSAFADSVVRDQKEIIREEDEKMMKHILETEDRERADENRKADSSKNQKQQMRIFLNKQMDEKKTKDQQEQAVNTMQAEIWAKDRENYLNHEKNKNEYIKMVNKKHAEILQEQMKEKSQKKKKGKMNIDELLQNKKQFEKIVENDPEQADRLKKANEQDVKR